MLHTATKIASITNSNIVQLTDTQTLTNKTLTSPTITGTGAIAGTFTGDVTGDLTGNADTATKIASITNSNIVQLTDTQTLTNKTLTSPTITGTGAIAGTFTGDVTGDLTGNADTATKIASITNSNIVQLTDTQTLTNKTLTSPTITGTGAIAGTFTGDVIGNVTGNLTGDLNGTINTATTATTQTAGDNSTKVATTEFVNTEIAAGTSATVSSVNNHIQSSTNDSNAVTNGTEYSATASIAAGSRTFNSANSVNTFNAGIDLNSNSIVSITLSQAASVTSGPGTYNIQPVVTNINATNNTFTITTYASGSLLAPNTDFTFNFFVIK